MPPFGPSPLWYRSSFLKGPPGSQQSPHAQPPPHNPSNPMMGPHGQVRRKHFLSNNPLSFIPSKSPPRPHTSSFFSSFHSPLAHFLLFLLLLLPSSPPLAWVLFSLTPRRCQPPPVATSFYESRASGGSRARSSPRPSVGCPCVGWIIHCLPHPPEAACGGLHTYLHS